MKRNNVFASLFYLLFSFYQQVEHTLTQHFDPKPIAQTEWAMIQFEDRRRKERWRSPESKR